MCIRDRTYRAILGKEGVNYVMLDDDTTEVGMDGVTKALYKKLDASTANVTLNQVTALVRTPDFLLADATNPDPYAEDADSAPEGEKGENGRNMLFDVIVANLPYIAEGEKLAPEVMKDPHTALFGGPKGWEIIERFLARARDYLNEDGFVALEIGYDQASVVTQIMDGYGYNYIEVLKDMSGVSRFPFGYR